MPMDCTISFESFRPSHPTCPVQKSFPELVWSDDRLTPKEARMCHVSPTVDHDRGQPACNRCHNSEGRSQRSR